VPLAATASDPSGAVSKVDYYYASSGAGNNTLIATATASP
jgi:hypothetical protein